MPLEDNLQIAKCEQRISGLVRLRQSETSDPSTWSPAKAARRISALDVRGMNGFLQLCTAVSPKPIYTHAESWEVLR
ncbi:hypothetical protein SRHO_G00274370 [Serrasalmus rhombeus]